MGDVALAQEVSLAAPGAEVTRVSGWQAIDRLAEGDVELIVAGDVEDVGAASLVRFARRCEVTPSILIANDAPKSTRMRKAYPQVAHYFVDRPIRGEDLTRVLSPVR